MRDNAGVGGKLVVGTGGGETVDEGMVDLGASVVVVRNGVAVAVEVGTAVDDVGAAVVTGSAAPGTNMEQLRTTYTSPLNETAV